MKLRIPFLFSLAILAGIVGCRKDVFTTDSSNKLEFSKDTVIFDTVFTTVGSATRRFTIHNPHNRSIRISEINLARGAASNFRINVDGVSGISFTDVEIPPEDSLWVFAEVTLDPNNQNTPMIITDSVTFVTNGNFQDVDLVAWGQDAYFYGQVGFGVEICGAVWNNDKPHVIYGFVVVDTNCTLTINQGTQVHCHANSGIAVETGGSLIVNGTPGSPVVFQGDRLEHDYDDIPGQWATIWIRGGSTGTNINHAIVKNSSIGIWVDAFRSDPSDPNVLIVDANTAATVRNTVVQNCSGMSIWGRASRIRSTNSVYGSAGQFSGLYTHGGDYEFRHCTFANYYSNGNRQTPLVLLNNYQEVEGQAPIPFDMANAYFGNCIFYGNLTEELGIDLVTTGTTNYLFDRCMVKIDPSETDVSDPVHYKNLIVNQNPKFDSTQVHRFMLKEESPAIDKGDPSITAHSGELFLDLEGKSRKLSPDIGAYERH